MTGTSHHFSFLVVVRAVPPGDTNRCPLLISPSSLRTLLADSEVFRTNPSNRSIDIPDKMTLSILSTTLDEGIILFKYPFTYKEPTMTPLK